MKLPFITTLILLISSLPFIGCRWEPNESWKNDLRFHINTINDRLRNLENDVSKLKQTINNIENKNNELLNKYPNVVVSLKR